MSWLRRRIQGGRSGPRNWFGDGSDGDIRITSAGAERSMDGGVTWAAIPGWILVGSVVSIPSVQDGDMVVVNARNLTVDAGYTLTVAHRCRGLCIYVLEDLTLHGTVAMTARGPHADPADATTTADTPVAPSDGAPVDEAGLMLGWFASGHDTEFAPSLTGCGQAAVDAIANQPSGRGLRVNIPRQPALGGASVSVGSGNSDGNPGGSGSGPGGGGSGGVNQGGADGSGRGGNSTCWSGGPGGGGVYVASNPGQPGDDHGGPGGAGDLDPTMTRYDGGGGGGNPGGPGGWSTSTDPNGGNGTGGWLLMVVGGNVYGTGKLASRGVPGGVYEYSASRDVAGGGSTGSGVAGLVHGGANLSTVDIDVSGVPGAGDTGYGRGGPGGPGYGFSHQIDP